MFSVTEYEMDQLTLHEMRLWAVQLVVYTNINTMAANAQAEISALCHSARRSNGQRARRIVENINRPWWEKKNGR